MPSPPAIYPKSLIQRQVLIFDAVSGAFENNIDYAMLVKIYGATIEGNNPGGKYSPNQCLGAKKPAKRGPYKKKAA